jgi:hypothetical protein
LFIPEREEKKFE